jgi:hypothetical protein
MSLLPAGTVKDVQLAGASTDQMALVEYGTLIEAQTALKLNGMKIGDAYTLQVKRDRAGFRNVICTYDACLYHA